MEDEPSIRELVSLHLGLEGLIVEEAADGEAALELLTQSSFDLVLLDLMLPKVDGLSLCRAIRGIPINKDVPILIVTARREEADKIVGLESGADDYMTKPFGVGEFAARVRALLRRPRHHVAPVASPKPISVGPLTLDRARRQARIGGQLVELTANEFAVLTILAEAPGIVFTREELLLAVWGRDRNVTTRSVDTVVKRLRRKIEPDSGRPSLLLTVWGTGYKLNDELDG